MYTKLCHKCNTVKTRSEFCKDSRKKSGLCSQCKECRKQYNNLNRQKRLDYYESNKEIISLKNKNYRKLNKEKLNRYYQKNRKKRNEQYRKWYNNNKKYHSEQHKKWREKNKDKVANNHNRWYKKNGKKYDKKRRKKPEIKLIDNVRRRINSCLKKEYKNNRSIDYLGIDIISYKFYLESLFQEGMCWENYGLQGWHIDHIMPLSSAKNIEELISLFHYTNTQPLWAKDNLKKSNRII